MESKVIKIDAASFFLLSLVIGNSSDRAYIMGSLKFIFLLFTMLLLLLLLASPWIIKSIRFTLFFFILCVHKLIKDVEYWRRKFLFMWDKQNKAQCYAKGNFLAAFFWIMLMLLLLFNKIECFFGVVWVWWPAFGEIWEFLWLLYKNLIFLFVHQIYWALGSLDGINTHIHCVTKPSNVSFNILFLSESQSHCCHGIFIF